MLYRNASIEIGPMAECPDKVYRLTAKIFFRQSLTISELLTGQKLSSVEPLGQNRGRLEENPCV